MGFEKATRRPAKLRMALTGPAGSGKTLGALYIGYGLTGDWDRVALIDTERERARLYAGRADLPFAVGEFLYQPLRAPFSPERYRAMVAEGAQTVGPDGVVIVDSLSHAWMGEGGVLDIGERSAARSGRRRAGLIDAILAADCHAIATMRLGTACALRIDARGGRAPVGLERAPVWGDDAEYAFDIVLDVARDHVATARRGGTFLDPCGAVIVPELGARIGAWLGRGAPERAGARAEETRAAPAACADCGRPILPGSGKSVAEIMQGTAKIAGRPMCLGCFRKFQQARMDHAIYLATRAGLTAMEFQQNIEGCVAAGTLRHDSVAAMDEAEYGVLLELLAGADHERV